MTHKIQYKQTTKKVNLASLNTYSQFMDKVKASFKVLPQPFRCYYQKDNNNIDIYDDATFLVIKQQNGAKIQVVQGQAVKPKLNSYIVDTLQQSKGAPIKQEDLYEQQNSLKQQHKSTKRQSLEGEQQFQKRECSQCKKQIIGKRWKSLDRFDIDACELCFNRCRQRGEQFLFVQSEEMLAKINLRGAIYHMFDPSFVEQEDDMVKPWIKQGDITLDNMQAVSQIWRASQPLIRRMIEQF